MIGDVVAAFGLTVLAELGDKSQLLLIALATRWPKRSVALGGVVGIAAVQLLAAAVGGWVGTAGDGDSGVAAWLPVVVGIGFVGVGLSSLWSARGMEDPTQDGIGENAPENVTRRGGGSIVMTVATLTFVAELGDKTMFTTAGLAAVRSPFAVFVGSMAGFVLLAVMAVAIGAALAERLPDRMLRLIGGGVFVAVGLVILVGELA